MEIITADVHCKMKSRSFFVIVKKHLSRMIRAQRPLPTLVVHVYVYVPIADTWRGMCRVLRSFGLSSLTCKEQALYVCYTVHNTG